MVNLKTPHEALPFEFPTTPQVTTDWANVKSSKWIKFEEGKSYPFKLERKVAGISESTGIDGWKQLGLECKSLEGKPGADALLPKGEYMVDMKLQSYPVKVTLPKSSTGYKLGFKGKEVTVKTDKEAGPGLLSLFGAQCSVNQTGGEGAKVFDFEGQASAATFAESYCGVGSKVPKLTPDGDYESEMVKIGPI